ncbi:MAG: FAD-dependent oxidoreductase [Shimia sp.]
MSYDYDLFVIGGGSGGVRAARVAAAEGKTVGLAEESRLGGTCVIRGCVPKKLMVFASGYSDAIVQAKDYGWNVEGGDAFDWPAFSDKLRDELERLEGVYRKLLEGSDVTVHDARAVLKDPHTIELSDGTTVTAEHILLAMGGWPTKPGTQNEHLGMTSNDIFHLKELPNRLLIVGGGYIACEFACIMDGLGVDVTMINRNASVLRGFDEEARGLILDAMMERGITFHGGTTIVEMKPAEEGDGGPKPTDSDAAMGADVQAAKDLTTDAEEADGPVWVKTSNGKEEVYDAVLFATGRSPNTDGMGLTEAGVELGRKGEVKVDEYSKTSVDHIYAIGDVTGRVELTPVAIREGMAFVETVFKGNPTPVDHDLIPTAVFTQPELGTVGLSEEDAAEQEAIDVYCTSFRAMKGAFINRSERVMMKLVVSQETDKVLGCHIVAPEAGELIQMVGIAIKMGATKADIDRVCAVHPTMAEELVTMKTPLRSA